MGEWWVVIGFCLFVRGSLLFVVAPSVLICVMWPGQIPSCRLPVCVNADVTKFGACLLTGAGFPFLKKIVYMCFGTLEKVCSQILTSPSTCN